MRAHPVSFLMPFKCGTSDDDIPVLGLGDVENAGPLYAILGILFFKLVFEEVKEEGIFECNYF